MQGCQIISSLFAWKIKQLDNMGLPKNLWVVARYDLTTKRKKSSRFREKTTFKGCTARK